MIKFLMCVAVATLIVGTISLIVNYLNIISSTFAVFKNESTPNDGILRLWDHLCVIDTPTLYKVNITDYKVVVVDEGSEVYPNRHQEYLCYYVKIRPKNLNAILLQRYKYDYEDEYKAEHFKDYKKRLDKPNHGTDALENIKFAK